MGGVAQQAVRRYGAALPTLETVGRGAASVCECLCGTAAVSVPRGVVGFVAVYPGPAEE